jgi:hypothetical protein
MVDLQEIYQAPAATVQCQENGLLSLTLPTHSYRVQHTQQAYPCNKRHFIGTVSTLAGGIKIWEMIFKSETKAVVIINITSWGQQ